MAFHTTWSVPVVGLNAVLGCALVSASAAAAPPASAPATLISSIEAIETAANAQSIEQVMALYSDDFQGPDGFTRDQYQTTLGQFWQQYSSLSYAVDLLSWEQDGDALLAETLTTVEGIQTMAGREMQLVSEVRSRQRFENGQIVSQEILSEESRLSAGQMPPSLEVLLPNTVTPGGRFNYDAIVAEPLGDRVLLGLALDEGVTAEDFLTPRPVDLESLTAGGLFKVGQAPVKPDQRWISAILVREDGIVIDTRRLRVEE